MEGITYSLHHVNHIDHIRYIKVNYLYFLAMTFFNYLPYHRSLDRLLVDGILAEGTGEQLAEEIDEAIHSLQYKLDHCKRCF